jgi:phosphoesterase RecJ-like protein
MKKKNDALIAGIAEFIAKTDNFLIITHENPDGDALGSTFAMLNMLHDCGKTAEALLPEALPEKYLDFIPCNYRTEVSIYDLSSYNCCIIVDNPNPARAGLGGKMSVSDITIPIINIDHHPDNMLYGKYNLVMPDAAAAAEILFMIFRQIPRAKISPATATLLLLGIIMDTGGFRFDNTSARAMNSAADLIELKAAHHEIMKNMFFSKPLPQQKFESELFTRHLQIECGGKFAWFYIPEELISKYNIDMRNSEGLIEILRALKDTDIVAVMQRREDGFKISLRSKDHKYSVGKIARKLNGGGHELAAGCIIKASSLENAGKILLSHVERVLHEAKS